MLALSYKAMVLCILSSFWMSCSGPKSAVKRPARVSGGKVEELHLFGAPVALNLDGVPGPDGVGVRVYASARKVSRGIPITSGLLELLIFDGPLTSTNNIEVSP